MKKPLLFIATALLFSFVVACNPEEIEQNTQKQTQDTGDTGYGTGDTNDGSGIPEEIKKQAKDGGDQGLEIEVPR